jgi:hypothetical protein
MKIKLLNRSTIQRYFSEKNQKKRNAIEQQAQTSLFESDALEGWEVLANDSFDFKKLDRRFGPKDYFFTKGLIGLIALSVIGTILLIQIKPTTTSVVKQTKKRFEQIAIINNDNNETTPIIISEPINENNNNSITIIPVKKSVNITLTNQRGFEFTQLRLPFKGANEIQTTSNRAISIQTKKCAEFYLYALKLVDYRNYRSKQIMITAEEFITGTPANINEASKTNADELENKNNFTYIEFLGKAMEVFSKNDYKKSLWYFKTILANYPDDVNALFYSGISWFQLKEYDNATTAFQKVVVAPFSNFNEEADWHTALSLLKQHRKEAAETKFAEIIRSNGFYAAQARKLMH